MDNIEKVIQAEEKDDNYAEEFMKQMKFESNIMITCPICANLLSRQYYDKTKLLAGFSCKKCEIVLIIKQKTKNVIM